MSEVVMIKLLMLVIQIVIYSVKCMLVKKT